MEPVRMIRYAFGAEPSIERKLAASAGAIENGALPFVAHRLTDLTQLGACEMLILDVSVTDPFLGRAFASWRRLYRKPELKVVCLSAWGDGGGAFLPSAIKIRPYRAAINLETYVRRWTYDLLGRQPEAPIPFPTVYKTSHYPITRAP